MTRDELQELFSKAPASFQWSQSEDGTRAIGVSAGAVLDLLPDQAQLALTFPPDEPELAARNGTLALLLLTALRPDWDGASRWLADVMRRREREAVSASRQLRWTWSPRESRATLKVRWL